MESAHEIRGLDSVAQNIDRLILITLLRSQNVLQAIHVGKYVSPTESSAICVITKNNFTVFKQNLEQKDAYKLQTTKQQHAQEFGFDMMTSKPVSRFLCTHSTN